MWEPDVPVSKAMVKVQRGFLERVFGLHEEYKEGGKVKSLL
jgi:hypothetical protein